MAVSTLLKLRLNNKWSCNNPFSCWGLCWTYAKIFLSPSSAEEVCWDSSWSAGRLKEQVRIKFFSYVFGSVKLICGVNCLIAHKISWTGGNTDLYDFLNCGINVQQEISQKWPLVDWHSVFTRKRNAFIWGELSRGVANVLDHPCFALQTLPPLPKQFVCVKVAVRKAAKGTRYIGQTTGSSGFPTASLHQVIRCSANSVAMTLIRKWLLPD